MPESPGTTSLAVVVCCRDRAELLEQALAGIRDALRPEDDLVVVDSASTDPRVQQVAHAAGARLVVCREAGLSRARNAGWRHTDRTVVVFTDDDCLPAPGWRRSAVEAFEDDRIGGAWGEVTADRDSDVPLSSGETHTAEMARDTALSGVGHGASMAFRRSALEAVDGFDEWLGAGGHFRAGEDKDALWRVFTNGWRVIPAPAMAVTHVVHRDTAAAIRVMHGYGLGAGAVARKRLPDVGRRRALVDELWLFGALPTLRHLRHGRWAQARATVQRTRGFWQGWRAAGRMRVVDGHLIP